MNEVPDWLWQGLTVWAAGKAIEWAWVHREAILSTLRIKSRQPVLLSGEVSGGGGMEGTLTVGTERQILYDVRSLVGSERQILYNVEAPKPSLARRLEDLASWYLHVS